MGGDGDPLDALVLVGDPTFPGCRIRVRADRRLLHDGREGLRREGDLRVAERPGLVARARHPRPAARVPGRDRALLPGLQGPRGQEDRDARVRQPSRGARGDRRRARARRVGGWRDGRGVGTRSVCFFCGARVGPLGDAEHDHASDAPSDGRPGLPELHGSVPSIRGAFLGKGLQLCLVARDDHRAGRRARAPLGRSRLHLVRADRDRPGHRDRRCAHRLQRVEDPDLQPDLGLGPRGRCRRTGRRDGGATSRSTGSNSRRPGRRSPYSWRLWPPSRRRYEPGAGQRRIDSNAKGTAEPAG